MIAIAALFAARHALADERGDKAMAEALFRAAKDLQAHGKISEACPKYAESHRIDPKPGTVLNLASCHEAEGKTASAWADYAEAVTLAQRTRQGDREKFARSKQAELEKKLSYVTFEFPTSSSYDVAVDGKTLTNAAAGTRVPIDPGQHAIEAKAAGKTPWSSTFTVDTGPSEKVITIPELSNEKSAAPPPPVTAAPAPPPPAKDEPPREETSRGGTQRTLGWIIAGAGVVGLGVGGFFGARTLSQKSTVDAHCAGSFCDDDGLAANDRAKSAATISTISFIAGAALIAGGVVLVLTAPRASHTASW
jgi:hypothetical protein